MKKILIFLLTATGAASAETLTFEGRWMDADGNAQTNKSVQAVMKVYLGETDSNAVAQNNSVTINTDGDGFFVASAEINLSDHKDKTTFWLGVTPGGGEEIKPRMRVSPAPFAIRAAEAKYLEVEGELKIEGTVTATTLSVASNMTAGTVVATKSNDFHCDVTNADSIYINKLDWSGSYGSGHYMSLFRATSPGTATLNWDAFHADQSLPVAQTANWKSGPASQTETLSFEAEDDGIAVILVRNFISKDYFANNGFWEVTATLSNGKTTFFKDAFVEKGSFTAREVSDWWSLTHFHSWTIPVLKGKPFKLTVTNKRNSTHMYVNTEAKVQLFYVGAE